MKTIKFLSAIALVSVFAVSCKETPKPEVEEVETVVEEVIEVTVDSTATLIEDTTIAIDSTGAVIEETIEEVVE